MSLKIGKQERGVNTISLNDKKVGVIFKQGQKDWATFSVYYTAVDFPVHSSSAWQLKQWQNQSLSTTPRIEAWVFLNSFSSSMKAKRFVKKNFKDKKSLQEALFESYKKSILILNQ